MKSADVKAANFNVDSIKLSSNLKIIVGNSMASFIEKSFDRIETDANNQDEVIKMIYLKC
jgi:hypothetical protein